MEAVVGSSHAIDPWRVKSLFRIYERELRKADVPSPPWLMPMMVSTRNSAPVGYQFQYLLHGLS